MFDTNYPIYLPNGAKAFLISLILKQHSSALYIFEDKNELDNLITAVKFYSDVEILMFPKWDTLAYDRVSPSASVMNERLNVIHKIQSENTKKLIFIEYGNLSQRFVSRNVISKETISIHLGDKISRANLFLKMTDIGYVRSDTANNIGEFAVRGDIIDVASSCDNIGYRISFIGDIIDSIKVFDTETQISSSRVSEIYILPVSEVVLNDENVQRFKDNYRRYFGVSNDPLYEAISHKMKYAGMEHWLSLFYASLNTFFDYLPTDCAIISYNDFMLDFDNHLNTIIQLYNDRLRLAKESKYFPLPPDQLYLTHDEINLKLKAHKVYHHSALSSSDDKRLFTATKNLFLEASSNDVQVFEVLNNYLKQIRATQDKNLRVLMCCQTMGSFTRTKGILQDHGLDVVTVNSYDELRDIGKSIGIAVLPIESGFIYENFVYLIEADLLCKRSVKAAKRVKKSAKFFQELNALMQGEYVVHIEHGIGRFEKLETLEVTGVVRDFIKIIYKDDDKLYLPVENLELITKYGGEDTIIQLDKLGGISWQQKKAKLKKKLKIAAEELLRIAALREIKSGIILEPIAQMYEKFRSTFAYVETEDQMNAIEDVEADLSSGRPMDRLVCGDVGFGKTEVALRAAAITVLNQNPMQVAIIVPTTLLCRQHYKNFKKRFEDFPVRIAEISRLVSKKNAQNIKEQLSDGQIDIVIGTHALLADDMKFKNLGLIIIDEEQHFGVIQKEKLKKLKSNTHILTLSATPIPRTLQMSLSGIKDLSLIATPPINRKPIKTYVMPYDAFIIREAIMRECARGGRVFYVTPRVAYLEEIEHKLKEVMPQIKVHTAHGKMLGSKIDSIMNDFYDGKFDVLISTSIVESGLDIPFANTMIIDRADMFGLSQLYQIRGRVGRSNANAYAYLITPSTHKMPRIAQKRLEIIQSLDTLGAGFNIASHDMDIRGYGNLVGDEQSGHIREVGVELYQNLLSEAVENLKANAAIEDDHEWSPTINIGVSIQIPVPYITEDALRLSIYRRIANISTIEELESFKVEMIDRFGPFPVDVEHLFYVIRLKQMAKEIGIEKIESGEKAVIIKFRNGKPKSLENIITFIANNRDFTKLRDDGKLIITRTWQSQENKIKGIIKILEDLL